MKRAVIIQGPSNYVLELKEAWKGIDIIWSTWVGEENKYTKNDICIFSEIPKDKGTCNLALQKKSTLQGILKAKELGYDRVIKCRSDIIPINLSKFLLLFKDNLNFTFWHTHRYGYFVDYIMEGETDDVLQCWSFLKTVGEYSEELLTNHILKNFPLEKFNFFGKNLNKDNDLFWIKRNIKLSTYNTDSTYVNKIKIK